MDVQEMVKDINVDIPIFIDDYIAPGEGKQPKSILSVLKQQINFAMRKVTGVLNAGSFKNVSFRETVKDFVPSDQTFNFMNAIEGTPAY